MSRYRDIRVVPSVVPEEPSAETTETIEIETAESAEPLETDIVPPTEAETISDFVE